MSGSSCTAETNPCQRLGFHGREDLNCDVPGCDTCNLVGGYQRFDSLPTLLSLSEKRELNIMGQN
jgi:hypothetical protein